MAATIKGTNCCWGSKITTSTDYGRVISWSRNKTATETELLDEDGDIVTWIASAEKAEITLEIVPDSTTYTTPAIGNQLSITDAGGDFGSGILTIVTAVGDTQVNTDTAKLSVTVKKYPSITLS